MAPNLVFLSFIFTHKVNLIVNKVNLLTSGVRLLLLILFNLNVTKKHYCYLGVMHWKLRRALFNRLQQKFIRFIGYLNMSKLYSYLLI